MLKQNVKGLGKTGLDIFARRIQGLWAEAYPFADQKSISALETFGLPRDPQELKNLLDEKWTDLDVKDLDGDVSEQKRRTFVRVVERVVGISLEGNSDSAKEEAVRSSHST